VKERLDLSKHDNLSAKVTCVLSRIIVTPQSLRLLLLFARIKEESEQTILLQVVLPAQVCLVLQIDRVTLGTTTSFFSPFSADRYCSLSIAS
jgi:hypothetical protein